MDVNATEYDQSPPSPNVALNAEVLDVSSENPAESASKALDGSSSTKWAATDMQEGYLTIDIGEEKTIRRWRVEHAESGGEEKDMNRSEEHTSELQSRGHLVCRLLLEKKKKPR